MSSLPSLNSQLTARAKGATVDVSSVLSAGTLEELAKVGGGLILTAKGNANLAAIQLAMRIRAAELDNMTVKGEVNAKQ